MVSHNNKSINYDSVVIYDKSHAFNNNILILIRLQQHSPLKICRGKKLRIFSNNFSHSELKLLNLFPVVGTLYTYLSCIPTTACCCAQTTNSGKKKIPLKKT